MTASKFRIFSRRTGIVLVVFAISLAAVPARAESLPDPIPLPPPPELLDELSISMDDLVTPMGSSSRSTVILPAPTPLPPPAPVAAAPAPQPLPAPAPAVRRAAPQAGIVSQARPANAPPTPRNGNAVAVAQAAVRVPASNIVISPPAADMPEDYFDLPFDEGVIPGVLLPELDEDFYEPSARYNQASRDRRPAERGLSVSELEPYFARAKGEERVALDARRTGDESGFRSRLERSIEAYTEVINMADAATEAREEAWYGVARCEYRLGNWWRSFDALERSFPTRYQRAEVLGRVKLEMFIGERLWRMGESPVQDALLNGEPMSGYQAASRVYGAVVFNQPTEADAPLALLRRGDASSLEGEWDAAAKYYRQVVQYFPDSEPAMQARSSLTEAIYRQEWPAGFPEAAREDVASIMDDVERFDTKLTDEAEERRQRAVAAANNLEAETKLRHAREYMRSMRVRKSRDAAVFLLGDIVSLYPGTEQAVEAANLLRDMGIEPPMVLAEGNRFPLTAGWSGAESTGAAEFAAELAGGSVAVEGQNNSHENTTIQGEAVVPQQPLGTTSVWPTPPPPRRGTDYYQRPGPNGDR